MHGFVGALKIYGGSLDAFAPSRAAHKMNCSEALRVCARSVEGNISGEHAGKRIGYVRGFLNFSELGVSGMNFDLNGIGHAEEPFFEAQRARKIDAAVSGGGFVAVLACD